MGLGPCAAGARQRVGHLTWSGRLAPLSFAQAAALAVCQCLAVEATHPPSPGCEDCSASEAAMPTPVRHIRAVRAKRRRPPAAPAAPAVAQLMEMGFPRRNIEFALKSLTGATGNAAGSPGIAVSLCLL